MSYSKIQDYKAQSVSSMSKGEQLVLLYDEALKNLRFSGIMLKNNDMANFFKCTRKAKDVFSYLSSILNHDYEISANLDSLYDFFRSELVRAENEKSFEPLEPLIPMVEDLKSAWIEADKQMHNRR